MLKSVLDYLMLSEKNNPDKIAIVDREKKISYCQFQKMSKIIASNIMKKTSARKSPVVILMDKSIEAIVSFMGVVYSGNIYAPLDANSPNQRLNIILEMLHPEMIITDIQHYNKACELTFEQEKIFMFDDMVSGEINVSGLNDIQQNIIDTDPLYIICTSGSTGVPKGVVISHRAVIDFTEEASETLNLTEKEVFANQAPFYFDASVPDIYCTIRNGGTLHIIPQSMFAFPIKVLEYIKENEVNAIFWVPSALILVANLRALGEVDISCLKKVMFCGEVMPTKQLNAWRKHLPDALYVNYYGPSETTYASTYYIIDREFANDEVLPIGKAAVNTGVLVLNEKNELVQGMEIGELCIAGSGVALGYYNNPEKTKEVFVQNPLNHAYPEIIYRTGDLVRYNRNNELEYVSRKDFQIKHMGYRIELGEIENAVMSIDGIQRACCLYNSGKQQIVLCYQGRNSRENIIEQLKDKVPDYMIPGKIVEFDALPINANGKIDRVLLNAQYGN